MGKTIRVLHCPTTVGGNPQGLARAERQVGLDSIAIAFGVNYLNYETDETLYTSEQSQIKKDFLHLKLLWRIARKFDIVHYNFGSTVLPPYFPAEKYVGTNHPRIFYEAYDFYRRFQHMRDLRILKKLGKKIVVTYQGDDARQGDYCLANFAISTATEVEPGYYSPESDVHKRNKIETFNKHADRMYALNPDLLHMLPSKAQFLPYASVDPREWLPPTGLRTGESERLTVVHAPTHRGAKGTRFILDAVERIKGDGIDFEFVLVEGFSHNEARQLYERADLLIDQLLFGWYGALAVELMALGKPVICYIRHEDLKFIPSQMRADLPFINATPGTIYEVLKAWLTVNKRSLAEGGARSRRYAETWHDPLKIAARLKADYEDILS